MLSSTTNPARSWSTRRVSPEYSAIALYGEHGSAKARIVAIGVLSGQKRNVISPVDGKLEVPMIEKRTGQVISMQPDIVQIMDMQSYETFETPLPTEEEIRAKLATGVEIEYWDMLGKKKIVRTKG